MSERRRSGLGALFVIAIGVWLFLQVSVGELVERIQSYLPGAEEPKTSSGEQGVAFGLTGGGVRRRFVKWMKSQLGQEYEWGGTSRKTGFDCSGIIQTGCHRLGLKGIPRTSSEQIAYAKPMSIARAALTGGAVLWFPGHITVSAGDGIHTYEARGEAYGVVKVKIAGRGFQKAGIFPEFTVTGGPGVTKVKRKKPRRANARSLPVRHSRVWS